jgi:outer membrane protein assembly factor BamD
LRDIITQYPNFSYFDESLFLLGVSLIEQEQPEEASDYFTRLVRDYPNSEFSKKGREYLDKLGKPQPEPTNNDPAPERPSFVGKFGLILGYNGLDISKDGVLLSKDGDERDEVKNGMKPGETSSGNGSRTIRANTKSIADPSSITQTSNPSAPATATSAAATPNGNSQAVVPEANEDASKDGEAKDAESGDQKKKKDKDKDKEKEKDSKKKKGVLGIFR